jgi:hypothetical protein
MSAELADRYPGLRYAYDEYTIQSSSRDYSSVSVKHTRTVSKPGGKEIQDLGTESWTCTMWNNKLTEGFLRPREEKDPDFEPVPEYASVMPLEVWLKAARAGAFIEDDGDGYWVKTCNGKQVMNTQISVFGHNPQWATHVAWFDK